MVKGTPKAKVDLSSVGSSTPPQKTQTIPPNSSNEPTDSGTSEGTGSKVTLSQKTDKELVDYLINTFPADIKEELQFLAGCPERIGIEPLRDILISQTKTSKQVVPINCEGLSGRTEVWIEL